MAPEVANELPYNEKCDVYSMAILIWQMMACKVPYATYSCKELEDRVYNGDKRPKINDRWPQPIKLLLRRAWTADISARAPMKNLEDVLKKEITALRGGDSTGLEHYERRSTFVYRKN
jgi:serine/threonine protein kinase